MAVIRRNPAAFLLVGSVGLAVLAGLLVWPDPPPAAADPAYEVLAPATAHRVTALRSAAGLDDDALAALNLSAEQLYTLLGEVRDWYDTDGAEAWAARAAVVDQEARIRQLRTALHLGADARAALTAAQQTLAQLEAAYANELAGLRASVAGTLSPSQSALLDHLRAHDDVPMPFRILGLTSAQQAALSQARADYLQQRALARDDEARTEAADTYRQALAGALGPEHLQTLAAFAAYRAGAAARVVAALNEVLPVQE